MTALIVRILYATTVALKTPVVVGILLLLAWSLFETGRCLREAWERRRQSARWRQRATALAEHPDPDIMEVFGLLGGEAAPGWLRRLVPETAGLAPEGCRARLETLLQEAEFAATARLSRLRIGLRLGPVLGLMGTLIPMGPALLSVSRGDLSMMSTDLIIAFGTTVAGLLVGALCYVMLTLRQHWYARDVADLERLAGAASWRAQA